MIVQKIKRKYNFAKLDCCDEQCSICIDTAKNYAILKGELLVQTQPEKICDCIIFQDDKKIIIVELKSNSLSVGKIKDKFTNSGKKAVSMASALESSHFSLFMILLAKSYKNYFAQDRIRRIKVNIYGKKYPILPKKCGASLKAIIN